MIYEGYSAIDKTEETLDDADYSEKQITITRNALKELKDRVEKRQRSEPVVKVIGEIPKPKETPEYIRPDQKPLSNMMSLMSELRSRNNC